MAADVNLRTVARGTPGFSGADLANLVNEAALFAARASKKIVDMSDFEKAKDKILMGGERKSMVMNDDERKLTAYHEAGHAIVGRLVPDHDPVYKVSIIPRGRALGVTMFLPEEDRYSNSKQRINSMIAALFGGRVAEEEIFGEDAVTTGASNDLKQANQIARTYINLFGFNDTLGLYENGDQGQPFLGRDLAMGGDKSSEYAKDKVDREVERLINFAYKKTIDVMKTNRAGLDNIASLLLEKTSIDAKDLASLEIKY